MGRLGGPFFLFAALLSYRTTKHVIASIGRKLAAEECD